MIAIELKWFETLHIEWVELAEWKISEIRCEKKFELNILDTYQTELVQSEFKWEVFNSIDLCVCVPVHISNSAPMLYAFANKSSTQNAAIAPFKNGIIVIDRWYTYVRMYVVNRANCSIYWAIPSSGHFNFKSTRKSNRYKHIWSRQ